MASKDKRLPPSIKRQKDRIVARDQDAKGKFIAGNKANRKPRLTPVGSKAALSHAFIKALHADFLEGGTKVIETVREDHPDVYFRVVASLVPKELIIDASGYDTANMKELQERYDELKAQIEDELRTITTGKDQRTREIEATAIDVTPKGSAS